MGAEGGSRRLKKDGNDSLSIEHKEEIQVILRKSMDLLISSILNGSFYSFLRIPHGYTQEEQNFECKYSVVFLELHPIEGQDCGE